MIAVEKNFCLSRNGYTLSTSNGNPSKRWFIYWYHIYDSGFRKRVKVYGGINRFTDPQKRFEAACQLLAKIESGEYQQTFESVSLQKLFDTHFTSRCKGLRPKTRATYLIKINAFIDYCAAHKVDSLQHITPKFCERFLDSAAKHPTTTNAYRNTLKTFFDDFKRARLIEVNPFAAIRKMPESRRGKFPFNVAQVAELKRIIETTNPVLWMACQLEYYCFIRPGESRLLTLECINLDEHFILVPGHISKNKKTQPVSIPKEFEPVLREWLKEVSGQNTYILTRKLQPVGIYSLNRWHEKILKALGYSKRYSLYSWKHTGAIACVKAGISLKSLQMQMRHHSLDQLNEYLREMGVMDSLDIRNNFPKL